MADKEQHNQKDKVSPKGATPKQEKAPKSGAKSIAGPAIKPDSSACKA